MAAEDIANAADRKRRRRSRPAMCGSSLQDLDPSVQRVAAGSGGRLRRTRRCGRSRYVRAVAAEPAVTESIVSPADARPRRRHRRPLDVSGLELLGMRRDDLSRPGTPTSAFGLNQRRPDTESIGPKSKSQRCSSGSRPLKTDPSSVHGPCSMAADGDAERDVRRVEQVMGQRRHRVVERRRAVHERDRPERGRADRAAAERETASTRAARFATTPTALHEQIVRMLAIDDRLPLEDLAGLEQLAVARRLPTVAGSRLGHASKRERAVRRLARSPSASTSSARRPRAAARSALMVEHRPTRRRPYISCQPLARGHVSQHLRVVVLLRGCTSFADDERDNAIAAMRSPEFRRHRDTPGVARAFRPAIRRP